MGSGHHRPCIRTGRVVCPRVLSGFLPGLNSSCDPPLSGPWIKGSRNPLSLLISRSVVPTMGARLGSGAHVGRAAAFLSTTQGMAGRYFAAISPQGR